jgi:putative inorganic carbon (hco3(-)) transporter
MRLAPLTIENSLSQEQGSRNVAFFLFCMFIVGYFLHITARVEFLGRIHFDLIMAGLTAVAIMLGKRGSDSGASTGLDPISKRLWLLVGYVLVTIPFVEWPGSVLHNLDTFAKSLCFFFFVVATVDTTRKLKVVLAVFVSTQLWRVLEPLYMHLTSGYWGSVTSLGNWKYMDRLSGSPYDIINPNGLAFVILLALPLLQFLVKPNTVVLRLIWVGIACAMCYALVLTASRSGFLALVFMCLFVIWRSKHRTSLLALAVAVGIVVAGLMTDLQRERYVSIVSKDAPGAGTAHYRIAGVIGDFKVSLRRPFFGHGLGTSLEANANYRGEARPSHNLYTETAEELGYVGLPLVLSLLWSFLNACRKVRQATGTISTADARLTFLRDVADALLIVVAVDLFFSFASYGLSEPYWYLIGGFTVATARLATKLARPVVTDARDRGSVLDASQMRREQLVRVGVPPILRRTFLVEIHPLGGN